MDAEHGATPSWTHQLQYCTTIQQGATCCFHQRAMKIKHPIPVLHRSAADGLIHLVKQVGALGQLDHKAPEMAGATAMHVAAQCGQATAIRALADLGASVDLASDDGSTPLYMACLYCRCEAIKVLLELGSDPCQASENGSNPMDVACPETERVLKQWQRFSSPQRRAARMYGWGYLELPMWMPNVHTSFPQQFKMQVAALVLSLHVSGLIDGVGELTELIVSAIDAKHRAEEVLPKNPHCIMDKRNSRKRTCCRK